MLKCKGKLALAKEGWLFRIPVASELSSGQQRAVGFGTLPWGKGSEFVRISVAIRNRSNKTQATSDIFKIIKGNKQEYRKEHFLVDSREMNLFLLSTAVGLRVSPTQLRDNIGEPLGSHPHTHRSPHTQVHLPSGVIGHGSPLRPWGLLGGFFPRLKVFEADSCELLLSIQN